MDDRWWYLFLFVGTLLPVIIFYCKVEQVASASEWKYPEKVTGVLKVRGPVDIVDKLKYRAMGIQLEEEDADRV